VEDVSFLLWPRFSFILTTPSPVGIFFFLVRAFELAKRIPFFSFVFVAILLGLSYWAAVYGI